MHAMQKLGPGKGDAIGRLTNMMICAAFRSRKHVLTMTFFTCYGKRASETLCGILSITVASARIHHVGGLLYSGTPLRLS